MANVEKVWTNQDPVIRTQAEGEPLGLAQTTSAILSNGSEMDRWALLIPLLWGETEAFPAALGRPSPEHALTRFMGSDAHPAAFPRRSLGEGAGSRERLGGCQGGPMLGTARGPLV